MSDQVIDAPITLVQNIITAPLTLGGLPGPRGPSGAVTVAQNAPDDPIDRDIWIKIP